MTHFAGKAARAFLLAGFATVALAISSLAAQLPADQGTITGSSVRMRSGASTSTSILTVMDKGTVVTVHGMANSGWYNISYKGMTGCVSADYLKLIEPEKPVESSPPEETPPMASTTPPVETPPAASTVPAAQLPTAVGTVTGSSVRMRSGASTSTSILPVMDKGDVVAVFCSANNGWYKIAFKGKTGYVSADYLKPDTDGSFTAYGRVNSDSAVLAAQPEETGTAIDKNTAVTISGLANGWYSVTCGDGSTGYIRGDLLNLDPTAKYAMLASTPNANGQSIVALASEFLGTRYVYGGSGPKTFDCSGFTMYVAKQFGVSLPHSATSQWLSGKGTQLYSVSDMQPGDLVFFCDPTRSDGKACSHCGIYIGNGQFIHASSSKAKVVISDLTTGYYQRYFVGGLRLA